MYGVENNAGVFFAKKGYYKGTEVTVTHRDPESGKVWLDDYPVKTNGPTEYGLWVDADSVSFKGEVKQSTQSHKPKRAKKRNKSNQ